MSQTNKQQSNPFSTGGGGTNFETRIQAAFTVLMLTGRISPCLPPYPITKLKLQGSYAGFNTDDFIVFSKQPQSEQEARLLAQIKHDISITEGNETFAEVIQSTWADFTDRDFDSSIDSLALITGPLSATDIKSVRPILEWARHSENEQEFLTKVDTPKFSSDAKRKKLPAFKTHLKTANGGKDVSDKQLWEFLKAFHLIGYDLDTDSGSTLSILQSLIAPYSKETVSQLWARILDHVQLANQNAGTLTLENIPEDIKNIFIKSKLPKKINVNLLSAIKEQSRQSRKVLNQSFLKEVPAIPRHGFLKGDFGKDNGCLLKILNSVNKKEAYLFAIVGEAGYGKTTVLGQIYDEVVSEIPWVAVVRSEDIDVEKKLEVALGECICGLDDVSIFDAISEITKSQGNGLLLIDTLDIIIDNDRKILQHIIRILYELSSIDTTIVFTCRDYEYEYYLNSKVNSYLYKFDRKFKVFELKDFNEQEIRDAIKNFVKCRKGIDINVIDDGTIFANKIIELSADKQSEEHCLREIISKPILLRMLCELRIEEGEIPKELTVNQLYKMYWDEKINSNLRYGKELARKRKDICNTLAKLAYEDSKIIFCKDTVEDDLEKEFVKTHNEYNSVIAQLMSEGIIVRLKSRLNHKIEFFHQTFMEFVMALRLQSREASKDLEFLKLNLTKPNALLHFWRITRIHLTFLNQVEFESFCNGIDKTKYNAFRTIALAASTCDLAPILEDELLEIALQKTSKFQQQLFESALSVPTTYLSIALNITSELIRTGEESIVNQISQKTHEILIRYEQVPYSDIKFSEPSINVPLQEILSLIETRHKKSRERRRICFGWIISEFYNLYQKYTYNSETIKNIIQYYPSYGTESRCRVIDICLSLRISEKLQLQLDLLNTILFDTENLKVEERNKAKKIAASLLPKFIDCDKESLSNCDIFAMIEDRFKFVYYANFKKVINKCLMEKRIIILIQALGIIASKNKKLIQSLINYYFFSKWKKESKQALSEAIDYHGGKLILFQVKESFENNQLNCNQLKSFLEIFIFNKIEISQDTYEKKEFTTISELINAEDREHFLIWAKDIFKTSPEKFINFAASISEKTEKGSLIVLDLYRQLPSNKKSKAIEKITYMPDVLIDEIQKHKESNSFSDYAKVKFYGKLAEKPEFNKEAVLNLIKTIKNRKKSNDKSITAGLIILRDLAGEQNRPNVDDFIYFADSASKDVRKNSLLAIQKIIDNDNQITEKQIADLSIKINWRSDKQTAQNFCRLIISLSETKMLLPNIVADTVSQIVPHFKENKTLDKGIFDSVLAIFNAFARNKELLPQLRSWTIELIKSWDLDKTDNGSIEMRKLISSIQELKSSFIQDLVLSISPETWTRNVIVITSVAIDSKSLNLLEYIFQHCSENAKDKVKGLVADYENL